jgi:ribosomal protein S18 acetylase RimI-like enzyme
MNFYSEDIINKIIDSEDIENILDKIDTFYQELQITLSYYSYQHISLNYIKEILKDRKNRIAFRCMDTTFDIKSCPSLFVYVFDKNKETKEITYYILLICTKQKFKNLGYASTLLSDFIQHVKEKNKDYSRKIILSSIESAVTFYEKYDFKWTREDLSLYPILMEYEKYSDKKEYFILKLGL